MNRTIPATTVYIATSLDGFIARRDGSIDWLGEPVAEEDYGWGDFIADIDHIVMGRVTFEQALALGTWPYEDIPITVLSTTMKTVPEHLPGNVEVLASDPGALLERLAQQGCRHIYVDGGKTIQGFLLADLIDELIITTLPVLIGGGIPLFAELDSDMAWELMSTQTFEKGLVKSTYRRLR